MPTDPASSLASLQNARCFGCNYSLRELTAHRCPECGRPFDPDNSSTMNLSGHLIGPTARFFLRPPLWLLSLALVPLVLIHAWFARLPGPFPPSVETFLTVAWVALFALWPIFRLVSACLIGYFDSPPFLTHNRVGRWILFPCLAIPALFFLLSDAPFYLAFSLCRPALDRFAAAHLAAPLQHHYPDAWVGLFPARDIYATPTDTGFEIVTYYGRYGFVYSTTHSLVNDPMIAEHAHPLNQLSGYWFFYRTDGGPLTRSEDNRRRLAQALAEDPARAAASIPLLLELLKDPGWARNGYSVCDTGFRHWYHWMGSENQGKEPDLLAWFGFGPLRPDIVALARVGPAAVPHLIPLLADPVVRRHVFFILGEIGEPAAPAVPAIIPFLTDSDYQNREVAACTLGRIGHAALPAAPQLLALLETRDSVFRANALCALRSIHPAADSIIVPVAACIHRVGKPHDVRWDYDVDSIEDMIDVLDDYGPAAAAAVPELLALYHEIDPLVVKSDPLGNLARIPNAEYVRYLCVMALAKYDPGNSEIQAAAVEFRARHYLEPPPPAPRPKPPAPTPELMAGLIYRIPDPRTDKSQDAINTLLDLGPAAAPAIPALLQEISGNLNGANQDIRVQVAAIKILGSIGPASPEIALALAKALDPDCNFDIRQAAINSLMQLGPAAAAPALPALRCARWFDPSLRLRQAAAHALDQLSASPTTAPTSAPRPAIAP